MRTIVRPLAQTSLAVLFMLTLAPRAAAQAQDLRGPLRPSAATRAARDAVRELVPFLESDRGLKADVDAAVELVESGALVEAVERVTGPLD